MQCHTSHKDPGSSSPMPGAPILLDLEPEVFQGGVVSLKTHGPGTPVSMQSLLTPQWLAVVLNMGRPDLKK